MRPAAAHMALVAAVALVGSLDPGLGWPLALLALLALRRMRPQV